MATTAERSGSWTCPNTGSIRRRRSIEIRRPRRSTRTRSRGRRACSPRAGRSSSTPAPTPAARRRTSSSSASRLAGPHLVGRRQQPLAEERFAGLRDKVVAHLERPRPSTSSTPSPARIPRIGSACVWSATARTTRSSRRRSSSSRPTTSSTTFEADALVLHAPAVEADPTRTARAAALSSLCTRRGRRC